MSAAVSLATAVVVVTVAVLPFLTPAWVSFEQGRAQATAWTGYTEPELRQATDAVLADLVVGPPAFDVVVRGEPVLDPRERAHMRDVRGLFLGLWIAGAVAAVVLGAAWAARLRIADNGIDLTRAVRRGAVGLAVAVVAAGALTLVAFDTLFTLFHDLFFPAGTWTFDPATERLVQLFPYTFWLETSLAVGAVIVVLSLLVAGVSTLRRRADTRTAASAAVHAAR